MATRCPGCGMPLGLPNEVAQYHPYAACLMFKDCRNAATVRANLESILRHGMECGALGMTTEQIMRGTSKRKRNR